MLGLEHSLRGTQALKAEQKRYQFHRYCPSNYCHPCMPGLGHFLAGVASSLTKKFIFVPQIIPLLTDTPLGLDSDSHALNPYSPYICSY